MIVKLIYVLLFLFPVVYSKAQQPVFENFKQEIEMAKDDTIKMVLLNTLSEAYTELNPDSAFYYAERALELARKLNLRLEETHALGKIGYALTNKANYPEALQTFLTAIAIAEDPKTEQNVLSAKYRGDDELTDHTGSTYFQRLNRLSMIHQYLGILYGNMNNHEKSLYHHLQAIRIAEPAGNLRLLSSINGTLSKSYVSLKKYDSALIASQKAYDLAIRAGYKRYTGSLLLNLARIQLNIGNKKLAIEYFRKAITESKEHDYRRGVVAGNLELADFYRNAGNVDSSFFYAYAALKVAQDMNAPNLLLRSYTALAAYYQSSNINDSTVKYQALIIKMNDSLFNSKQMQRFQNIDFDAQQRQEEIQAAKKAYQTRTQIVLLLGGLIIFLIVAIFLLRSNRQRQKSNAILQRQKKEIEIALATLKTTQAQLIHQEKMASLGELTAGIAHEIQNPLNFVNNFSDVSNELMEEMKNELVKGNHADAMSIVDDVKQNLEKINHHGKRADAIVKNMLQHSRSSSGKKEPTDINALADEYLRLAYYGVRAKDKSFNVTTKTDFDSSIEKINVVPQEIGSVILNLINNAFYAVDEKKKQMPPSPKGVSENSLTNYEPVVTVSTKRLGPSLRDRGSIELRVGDNGNGIPQKILDKIFQPFFTTKSTGQGTGLGLSLAYDIVKAHSGELRVETKEGEGCDFIVKLPA